jgi:uroporphyrinogen-III synthase
MPEKTIHILSTRPVNTSLIALAKKQGIDIETLSFIETTAIDTVDVQQEIETASVQTATVVFTSMNAVVAVVNMLDGFVPDWQIYCMGNTTKELVIAYFGENAIAGTADHAAALAEELIDAATADEVFFFCGNRRRDELPDILREHGIDVTEIVVYETIYKHHQLNKDYDAVLFFSPSAVESFFELNRLPAQTTVFVIGKTTKQAVNRFSNNNIVVSTEPGKDQLVTEAIHYFTGKH